MDELIECYTDASYSKEKSTSVVAFKIGNAPICTKILKNVKNTEAEIEGIRECLRLCELIYGVDKMVNIYTDCSKAFQTTFNTNMNFIIIKVKGHQRKSEMNENDLIFKEVDKFARKTLRCLQH
jgi:ribonuclease HI